VGENGGLKKILLQKSYFPSTLPAAFGLVHSATSFTAFHFFSSKVTPMPDIGMLM